MIKTDSPNNNHYFVLDILRGISALLVCVNHLRAAMFVGFSEVTNATIIDKIFYLVTSFGHEAVIAFFVISGFLIGGTIIKSKDKFVPATYAVNRLTRLYTVLIPSLLMTAVIDFYLNSTFPRTLGHYYSTWSSGPTVENYSNSLLTFLGNCLYLQNIFISSFGTNSPLWSLSYEFWYYVTFPLLFIPLLGIVKKLKTGKIPTTNIVLLATAAMILLLMPFDMKIGFLIWVSGALIVFLQNQQFSLKVKLLIFIVFTGSLLSLKFQPIKNMNPHLRDLYLTLTFCFFLLTNLNNTYRISRNNKLISKITNFLSNISFTLYLFHFPLIVAIAMNFVGKNRLQPNTYGYAIYFSALAAILFVCYILWWLFERNTPQVKRFFSRK